MIFSPNCKIKYLAKVSHYGYNIIMYFSGIFIVVFSILATKKLESIKRGIEQLCSQDLLKDADIQIQQQLQQCVKLCDSAKTMFTEECQKLEAKHEELLKEKEELNTHLELLKQTKLHNWSLCTHNNFFWLIMHVS